MLSNQIDDKAFASFLFYYTLSKAEGYRLGVFHLSVHHSIWCFPVFLFSAITRYPIDRNFMELILNIYGNSVVMQQTFYQGFISYSGAIVP